MRGDDGFTLVESLVAIAVAGLIVTAVTAIMATGRDRLAAETAAFRALIQAESLRARLGLDIPPTLGIARMTFADGAVGEIAVEPYPNLFEDDPERRTSLELRRVTIRVTPAGRARPAIAETLVAAARGPAP